MTAPKVRLSIIIPNRNRDEDLLRCLKSIQIQSCQNYEVIIVDDASNDQLIYDHTRLKQWPVKIIRNPKRCGAAAAKNIGARSASGSLLMFLDSDSELFDPDVIRQVILMMDEDDSIGGIGGEIEITEQGGHFRPERCVSLKTGKISKLYFDCKSADRESEILSTCNLTVRRELFDRLNGFEELFYTYYEDTDFCLRLRGLGYRLVTSSRTLAIHHRSARGRNAVGVELLSSRSRARFVFIHGRTRDFVLLPLREIRDRLHQALSLAYLFVGLMWGVSRMPGLIRAKQDRNGQGRR